MTTVSAPVGMTPPVKMRTHSPAPIAPGQRLAGKRLADALEDGFRVRRQVGESHRVAVHRRVVVAGDGERRNDVGGKDAAQGAARTCTRSIAVTGERKLAISARAFATGIEFGS